MSEAEKLIDKQEAATTLRTFVAWLKDHNYVICKEKDYGHSEVRDLEKLAADSLGINLTLIEQEKEALWLAHLQALRAQRKEAQE